mgnify:CR=1 FL=1
MVLTRERKMTSIFLCFTLEPADIINVHSKEAAVRGTSGTNRTLMTAAA